MSSEEVEVLDSLDAHFYNCSNYAAGNNINIVNSAVAPLPKTSLTLYSCTINSNLLVSAGATTNGAAVYACGTSFNANINLNGAGVTMQGEIVPRSITLLNGGTFAPLGITNLANLLDTTIATPTLNQILYYNGTKWTNGSMNGKVTPSYFNAVNCTVTGTQSLYYSQIGNVVHCFIGHTLTVNSGILSFSFSMSIPIAATNTFQNRYQAVGHSIPDVAVQTGAWTGNVRGFPGANTVVVTLRTTTMTVTTSTNFDLYTTFSYNIIP